MNTTAQDTPSKRSSIGAQAERMQREPKQVSIPARDGYPLAGTLYPAHRDTRSVVILSSATAVPRRFYRHFAAALAAAGYTVLTYDYRGIGDSKPKVLKGFDARARDWALLDMAGVLDWVKRELTPRRLFMVGHSFGGQVAGLLDNVDDVDGMLTFSSQSGYWRMQGGEQKFTVLLHVHVSLPLLSKAFGYMPWSKISSAEDLPKGVALEWARWCRNPKYLLGDDTLPLHRYASFDAPVLAYSFGDDKWGRPESVDAMMQAYPNLERRHIEPRDAKLESIGHFGYFRTKSQSLWDESIVWLDQH